MLLHSHHFALSLLCQPASSLWFQLRVAILAFLSFMLYHKKASVGAKHFLTKVWDYTRLGGQDICFFA